MTRDTSSYFRRSAVDLPLGDPNTANARPGWHHKVRFPERVKGMVADDLALLIREGWRGTFNE